MNILIYTIITYANGIDRYIYTNCQVLIQFKNKTKVADYIKAQVKTYLGLKS